MTAALVALYVVTVKAVILYGLGRWWGLQHKAAVRLGLVISQGGEFAFVLFSAGALAGVIGQSLASLLTLAVSLSMAATPALLLADDYRRRRAGPETPDYEMPPGGDDHVIIAGFGRFGQIVARILRAKRRPVCYKKAQPTEPRRADSDSAGPSLPRRLCNPSGTMRRNDFWG